MRCSLLFECHVVNAMFRSGERDEAHLSWMLDVGMYYVHGTHSRPKRFFRIFTINKACWQPWLTYSSFGISADADISAQFLLGMVKVKMSIEVKS